MKVSYVLMMALGFLAQAPCGFGEDFKVELGALRETRMANGGTLSLNLKLIGARAKDVRGARVIVEKAIDESGVDLATSEKPTQPLAAAMGNQGNYLVVEAILKAPARNVAKVAELSGVIEFGLHDKGASTVITVNPTEQSGKPVGSDALANSLASVTVYLAPEFNKLSKGKAGAKETPAATATPDPFFAKGPAAMRDLFSKSLSPTNEITNQQIAVVVKDPRSVVLNVGVFGAKGEALTTSNTQTTMAGGQQTRIFGFPAAITPEMRVKLTVAAASATVRAPFSFQGIPLP